VFVKVLASVYHQRIDYPQTRHLTEAPGGDGPDGKVRRIGPRLERSS
jgi:hypothetical protein